MKKNPFTAALDIVSDILKWCCIVIMAFLIVAVAVQVIARRVLNNPTSWSEPLSQISFIWLTVFGCTVVVRDRNALNVDLLQNHLKGRAYYTLQLVCDLISIAVSAFWMYSSLLQVTNTWAIFEGGLKIRRGVIYIGIVFSFGMMCLFQLSNAVQSVISLVRGDKEPKKKEEGEATVLIAFLVIMFLGVPLALAMGAAGLIGLGNLNIVVMAQQLFVGLNSFTMIAIPLFIFMGNLMTDSGLTEKLINFCNSLFGRFKGGLGIVSIAAGAFFAAISGSAVASTASLGSILIPALKKEGYGSGFSGAIIAAAGSLGPIIPPSILLVIYGCQTGLSIGDLFMAGVTPGILSAITFILVVRITASKRNFPKHEACSARQIGSSFVTALPALMIPVIIVVGITAGIFTVTESAGIVTIYALIFCLIKKVPFSKMNSSLVSAIKETANVCMVIGASSFLAYILTRLQLPQTIVQFITDMQVSKFVLLILINIFLLIMGMLMAPAAAMIIAIPLLLPLAQTYNIDLIQFGLLVVFNLNLGILTPPVAVSLFMTARMTNTSFATQVKEALPFLAISFIVLILITYVPGFCTWLPHLL